MIFWKRLSVVSYLKISRVKRAIWFWKYVVLGRKIVLETTLMVRGNHFDWNEDRYLEALFIENLSIKELSVDSRLLRQVVESELDESTSMSPAQLDELYYE